MIIVKKIEASDKKTIADIVDIHMSTFTGFFLTFMGKGFLRAMYKSYCEHEKSDLLIAFDEEKPVGFLAYSGDMSGLYKYMIKKKLFLFAWYSLGAFLRKPKIFVRLIRAFLKPGESSREESYVELSSIGVRPDCKTQGVGTLLMNTLKSSVDFSEYEYISLETDAENNDKVNEFYKKNGFSLVREYATPEGRKMNEYHWRREE